MAGDVVVTGGSVTSVTITTQGTGYSIGDVLLIDDSQVGGGGGSGFQYTLNSNNTGVSTVTNISLNGEGYQLGDVLSVDDATVGGGGGSGFQFTVNKVGFCTALTVTSEGNAYELADTLILGPVGGAGIAQGSGLTASIATINSTKQLEMTQLGVMTLGPEGGNQLIMQPDGCIAAAGYSIGSGGAAIFSTIRGTTGTFTDVLSAQSTSTFTGMATFSGGITSTAQASTIEKLTAKLVDGLAATPSIAFDNSATTGLFRSAGDVIGVSLSLIHI